MPTGNNRSIPIDRSTPVKRPCRISIDTQNLSAYAGDRVVVQLLPETGVTMDRFVLAKPLILPVPSDGIVEIELDPNSTFVNRTYYQASLPDGNKFKFVVPDGDGVVEVSALSYANTPVTEVDRTILDYLVELVGSGGAQPRSETAGEAISALRWVYFDGDVVQRAISSSYSQSARVIGMTATAVTAGDTVEIWGNGKIVEDPSFDFLPGLPIFLVGNGESSQTAPSTDVLLQVGVAVAIDALQVNVSIPELFL